MFIAFEGIDGSGKSYQCEHTYKYFYEKDIPVKKFFAPSDRRWGKIAREIIQGKRQASSFEELSAFIEDLADLSLNCISPALAEDCVVLIDRYIYSTWAYQGLKHEDIDDTVQRVLECICKPDLVCVMTVPVSEAMERIKTKDKYETSEILDILSKKYDQLIFGHSPFTAFQETKFMGFDGTLPKEKVSSYVLEEIVDRMLREVPSISSHGLHHGV